MMSPLSFGAISLRREPSAWAMRCTGTPVIMATTSATLSSSTVTLSASSCFSQRSLALASCCFSSCSLSLNEAAFSKFCDWAAASLEAPASTMSFSSCSISCGTIMFVMWAREPASSRASMALSGKLRSETYLSVRLTQALSASSVKLTLWWVSYLSLMLLRICNVSSGVVGSTITFWKRRSSAPSFSMFLRYSSSVVAPMHWISPRASAGLRRFAASICPAEFPAPTIVCSSSMKRITSGFFDSSFRMALTRSSNWPRYLVPATREAMSSDTTLLSKRILDTLRCTMRNASPSTMADLPTPGSPISTGLFFLRRLRIWARRSISTSRPTTGSRRPSSAARVMSLPNLSSVGVSLLPLDLAACRALRSSAGR